ncbi:MAG: hypothetical protein ACP5K8_07305 [Nitrososphaeria archaeon]
MQLEDVGYKWFVSINFKLISLPFTIDSGISPKALITNVGSTLVNIPLLSSTLT